MTEDTHAKGARFDAPVEELGKPQPRWNWGDYISLSYVWGDSSDKKEIFVNGESFTVTQNLFEALAELRQSFEIREAYLKVWIDAIYIDQDNMKEREVEVKRMDLIYSEALAVRGWIGSPRTTTEFGMATTWLEGVRNLRTPDFLASIVPSSEVAHSLTTLAAALSYEPYWERLWIMQEIALASSLVFWYGRWRFTTMDIQNLLFVVERDGILQSFPQESSELGVVDVLVQFSKRMASVFARLAILRQIRREKIFQSAPMPLIEILGLAQSARAKDPRDKVYGILAILPKKISTRVQPDYSPSTNDQKTYTVFTQICLQEEGNLNTLERFVRRPSSQLGNMPSWAFNLSTDVYMYEKSGFFRMSDGKLQADKGRKGVLGFLQDNRTLLCDGILVDTIASLGAALYKPSNDQMISMTIEPPIKSSVFHEGPFHMPVDDRVRLALARVFCQNSAYNFADGPSLLDVPWVTEEDLELLHPETARGTVKKDTNDTDAGKKWPTFVETAYGDAIFRTLLHPNATFDVKGVGLRHYFTSRDEFCLSPQAYPDMSESVSNIVTCRRLCTTTDGLLGTVPNHARLGDRVAVLFGCDIPVILRPRGEKFEFLGGCFVEGWMKGEAIEKLDQGHLHVERIALC
ncbi:hypothetical protein Daus18300_002398 [Diaporthe australafricana]|uniref:Heterokaryon incompatibility domain-containing protein n=1 Tax=Diaporthe australafricana TaxID=127596 RepID=A0ABR3XP89_9PEZI